MANTNPAQAINVAQRIAMICDFVENNETEIVKVRVPVTMPPSLASLGLDNRLWVGLGIVGLWAALDAFAERRNSTKIDCPVCKRRSCVWNRFPTNNVDEGKSLEELEDLRHLYAHNYGGITDDEYFSRARHVLKLDVPMRLACGAEFNGREPALDWPHLRKYASVVQNVLGAFPDN